MTKKTIVIEYENSLEIELRHGCSNVTPSLAFHDSEEGEVARIDLEFEECSESDDVIWYSRVEE